MISHKVMLITGSKAQDAFNEGERNPNKLLDLGYCQVFSFRTRDEKVAFIEGLRIGSKTVNPWLFDLSESVLFRDT